MRMNRRNFLKAIGTVGSAVLVSPKLLASTELPAASLPIPEIAKSPAGIVQIIAGNNVLAELPFEPAPSPASYSQGTVYPEPTFADKGGIADKCKVITEDFTLEGTVSDPYGSGDITMNTTYIHPGDTVSITSLSIDLGV